ncbi:MAG: BtrH N-terminal domain-containing protein, partial [Planctomycetota bacterium]|nr:BtrH N-terminal domain-containing protein [Planctomycetota bacterium]
MRLKGFRHFGGANPAVAALKKALAWQDVVAPHTGKAMTEAMLLGIGGGIGAGWRADADTGVAIGTRHGWCDDAVFLKAACRRLGVLAMVKETADPVSARRQLDETLQMGKAAICWVDAAALPYGGRAANGDWVVLVYGHDVDGDAAWISDLARKGLAITADELAAARAPAPKHRLLSVTPPRELRALSQAVTDGIRECAHGLFVELDSMIAAERALVDFDSPRGFLKTFPIGPAFVHALACVYRSIMHFGNKGGALRSVYADFLDEAATVLDRDTLHELAAHYRDAHTLWADVAAAALPAKPAILAEARALIDEREDVLFAQGKNARQALAAIADKERALAERAAAKAPVTDKAARRI